MATIHTLIRGAEARPVPTIIDPSAFGVFSHAKNAAVDPHSVTRQVELAARNARNLAAWRGRMDARGLA